VRRSGTRTRASRSGAGFSLAEVLVTAAFAGLCGTLLYGFARSAFQAARAQQARSEAQDSAYQALAFVGRDLRQAGAGLAAGAAGIIHAGAERVAVRADLNGDGDTDDGAETVSYQEDAARHTLTRAAGAASPQPLADRLEPRSLSFAYWDAADRLDPDGGELDEAQRRRIRRIDVRFAIAVPNGGETVRVAVSSSVELRNAP
jgi:Tfp pilus assembly protein PilW